MRDGELKRTFKKAGAASGSVLEETDVCVKRQVEIHLLKLNRHTLLEVCPAEFLF